MFNGQKPSSLQMYTKPSVFCSVYSRKRHRAWLKWNIYYMYTPYYGTIYMRISNKANLLQKCRATALAYRKQDAYEIEIWYNLLRRGAFA